MRLIDIDNITALDIMHNVICDKEVVHKMLDFLQSQPTVEPQGIDKDRKSLKQLSANGKAAFYASIYDDLRTAAARCGWALGLHGSLSKDMDIMAMPWTENATPEEEMIKALSDCFIENPFKEVHTIPHYDKPNGRVVYTMPIFEDFYLDINIINQQPQAGWIPCKFITG